MGTVERKNRSGPVVGKPSRRLPVPVLKKSCLNRFNGSTEKGGVISAWCRGRRSSSLVRKAGIIDSSFSSVFPRRGVKNCCLSDTVSN